ncbi:hypothetical protein [Curtobacterium sp. MCBA15_001]|uniref:hypothetical protein n=1 Tax=Curtobacterium sp. MCBA15_001 TaxID=1898731 RepID=UPI0008DCDF7B|nr:hypothetical protein [Curtobacterium sp. MCBA15_001]OIH95533.1 hypothetical protein BIU90_02220 [Curtobacterium sp. MCBA15_001]
MTKSSWRKLLVVPAVLSLALGGALLTATSASAAPGNLVVTSPTEGQTTTSREVAFTGSAISGSKIVIHQDTQTGPILETINSVPSNGQWAVTHTYAADAPVAQTIFVDGVVGGSGFSDAKTVSFNLLAAPAQLTVTSPTEGQYLASRTVTVTGTGIPTANIALVPSAGETTTGILVGADGSWTGQVTFPADVDRAQSIVVNQIQGGAGRGSVTVNVNLPATQTLVVATPTNGQTTASRTVTFSGTGTSGSVVTLTGDFPRVQANVGPDNAWTVDVTFADDAAVAQSVRLTQVTGGVGTGDVTVAFSLPAVTTQPTTPALDTPVITSPKDGAALVGSTVTFEGTGTPGSNILVVAAPTDQVMAQAQSRAAAEPADPTDPIVVGADGTWSVTLAAEPGDYTAVAQSFLLDANGDPVLDENGDPVISDPSDPVQFTLAAAAATNPVVSAPGAGTGTGAVTPNGQLAFTGADLAPAGIAAGLLALAGTVLMVVARRRARMA